MRDAVIHDPVVSLAEATTWLRLLVQHPAWEVLVAFGNGSCDGRVCRPLPRSSPRSVPSRAPARGTSEGKRAKLRTAACYGQAHLPRACSKLFACTLTGLLPFARFRFIWGIFLGSCSCFLLVVSVVFVFCLLLDCLCFLAFAFCFLLAACC